MINTVSEQMRCAQKKITVKAGEKVKIWFENPDFMPHSLIFCQPGAATEVANAAVALGAKRVELGFAPANDIIIAPSSFASRAEFQAARRFRRLPNWFSGDGFLSRYFPGLIRKSSRANRTPAKFLIRVAPILSIAF